MVLAEKDSMWLPKSVLPTPAIIRQVTEKTEPTKRGEYVFYQLTVELPNGEQYDLDVKYGNKNFLINTISPDWNKWVGNPINVMLDETGFRKIY